MHGPMGNGYYRRDGDRAPRGSSVQAGSVVTMTNFEWFLLIVVVIVVPLIVAVVVTLWTIDQANKRKRANRADPQIGVKRKAALSPEEVEERLAERRRRQEEAAAEAAAAGGPSPTPSASAPSDVSRETPEMTEAPRNG
jgi:hypothetical protein